MMERCVIHDTDTSSHGEFIYLSDGGSAWVANTADQHQFLQVDLLRPHELTKLAVQGGGGACDCYTSTFRVLYSIDALVWKFYESGRIQQGNSDRYRTVALTFQPPIKVGRPAVYFHIEESMC